MDRRETLNFLAKNVLLTSDVCEILEVSKQRVAKLTQDKVIIPFKQAKNGTLLYYRGDILQYKYEKNKNESSYHMYNQAKAIGFEGTTDRAIKFYDENIGEFDEITNIYFYFGNLDAAIDGYYIPDTLQSESGLYNLRTPTCVLKDKNGQQMWLTGVLCGYAGTGPHGAVKLLKKIGIKENIAEAVFQKRVVKFIKDGEKWETISRDESVDSFDRIGRDLEASLYFKDDKLILLQDKRNYAEHRGVDYLEKYGAFVPDIVEIRVIPDRNTAIKNGYYKENLYGRMSPIDYYQLILVDKSGRELWLNALLDEKRRIKDNKNVLELIETCGFGYEHKDENIFLQMMKKLVLSEEDREFDITYIRK